MKKLLSVVIAGSLFIGTTAFAFSDVGEGHWAYEKIDEMQKSNIISGFTDGTFKPDIPLTREQAASIMTNFFEIALKENTKTFEDVPKGYWSEYCNGLVGQYMPVDMVDGKYYFRPFDNATRVEIAETISKIIGFNDEETDETIIAGYKDREIFTENDKKYISIMAKNEVMIGDDQGNFRPNDTITRAEFCSMIYNIYTKRDELKAKNLEKTVLTVNGEEVSYKEFELYFKLQRIIYQNMFNNPKLWNMEVDGTPVYGLVKETIKNTVISNAVREQKAKELGVALSDEVVEEAKKYLSTGEAIELCNYYGITTDELLEINLTGMLVEELAKQLYANRKDTGYIDVNSKIERVFYDARHILLATENKTEEEKLVVKEKAEELLTRVKEGEDFAKLAEEYSEDLGSKASGGLYEGVAIGEFVAEFEEAALATNVGMVYPELVETSYGYHIIRLEGKESVMEELTAEEKQQLYATYLEEVSKEWVEDAEVIVNEEVYKSL